MPAFLLTRTFSFLVNETSRLALIAALTVLPTIAQAATVDNDAGGSNTIALNDGDVGRFFTNADTTSTFTYTSGGGSLGDGFNGVSSIDGRGRLLVSGNATINGYLGSPTNHLGTLETNSSITLNKATHVDNALLGTGGGNVMTLLDRDNTFDSGIFRADNTLRLNNATLVGNLTTIAGDGTGTLNMMNGSQFYGNLGTGTDHLAAVTINNAASVIMGGGTSYIAGTGIRFAGSTGDLTISNNTDLGSSGNGTAISTAATGTNSVFVAGNANLYGAIGDSSEAINTLRLDGAGSTVNLGADSYINATTFNNATSSNLNLADNIALNGAVNTNTNDTGILNFGSGNTVTGNIGASGTALNRLNFNGTSANLGGDTFATTMNFGADGTTTVASGHATAGTITTATNNTGNLVYAGGTQAHSGNIGTAGNRLASLQIGNGSDFTQNSGTTFVAGDGINFAGAGTFNIGNNVALGANGNGTNITTANDGVGDVVVTSNAALFGNNGTSSNRLNSLIFSGGAGNVLQLSGSSYLNGLDSSGADSAAVMRFAQNAAINTLSAISAADAGNLTYEFAASNNASSVAGITSASTIDLTNTKIGVNTSGMTSGVGNRTRYVVAQGATNNAITGPVDTSVAVTGPLSNVTFRQTYNSSAGNGINNQLNVVALQNNYYTNAAASVRGNASLANYLENNVEVRNTDVNGNTVNTYLNTLDSQVAGNNAKGIKNTLQQVQPQAQSNVISTQANQGFISVINNRDANNRLVKNAMGGMNTGDAVKPSKSVWLQAFGGIGEQGNRDADAGYDTKVAGVAAGADREIGKHSVIGIAGSYSNGKIELSGADQNTKVDTYQASIYGHTYIAPQYFIEGQVGAAYNDYDSTRNITAAGASAHSDYSGWGYFANLKAGRDYILQDQTLITPFTSLTYIGNSLDAYTETGAGGLNLNADSDQTNLLTGRVGGEIAKIYDYNGSKIRPAMHLAYLYNIVQDNQTAATNFIGTGVAGSFNTNGINQSRSGFNAGVDMNLLTTRRVDVTASYDYEWRDRYDGHSGLLRARYHF